MSIFVRFPCFVRFSCFLPDFHKKAPSGIPPIDPPDLPLVGLRGLTLSNVQDKTGSLGSPNVSKMATFELSGCMYRVTAKQCIPVCRYLSHLSIFVTYLIIFHTRSGRCCMSATLPAVGRSSTCSNAPPRGRGRGPYPRPCKSINIDQQATVYDVAPVAACCVSALPAGVTCGRVVDICHSCLYNYQRNVSNPYVEPRVSKTENKVVRTVYSSAQSAHPACGVPSLRSVCNSTCLTGASRGERSKALRRPLSN